MNNNSNVSVIIPCYNDGQYLMEALNSVLNQTLQPEKIIIIDDGSDTKTKTILENINIDNVEVVFQENKGVCKARNNGINLATTTYILNLDADDFFEKTFIEKAVDVLKTNPDVGVVGCYYKTLKNNKISKEIIEPHGGGVKNFLVKNRGIACSMFRKICWEKIKGYDEKMYNGYEDWDFWISILKNNWKMHIIPEPLFTYRIKKFSRDILAFQNHDFELRNYIFTKHKETYIDNLDSFVSQTIYENQKLKKNKLKFKNTLDYKIGNIILKPLRFVKRVFNLF